MGMQVINLAELWSYRPTCCRTSPKRWPRSIASSPVSFRENTLTVAMCDPQKLSRCLDEIAQLPRLRGSWRCATEGDASQNAALDRYYTEAGESVEDLVGEMEDDIDLASGGRGDQLRRARST